MKLLLKYIGYFLSIAGAAAIIWQVAVYFADSNNEIQNIREDVKTIKEAVILNGPVIDSLLFKVNILNSQTNRISKSQEVLKSKFIEHFSKDNSVTKDDLLDIINSLEVKKNSN